MCPNQLTQNPTQTITSKIAKLYLKYIFTYMLADTNVNCIYML